MKSIKNTLIKNFVFVILLIVLILNLLLTTFVKSYYYSNAETLLKNQIQISSNFYNNYLSTETLIDNIYDNIDSFWNQSDSQVQILDNKGNLLMDSIGVYEEKLSERSDVKKAIGGQSGSWVGKVKYYNYKVMAVSEPLINDGEIIGVIRYVISLEEIDRELNYIKLISIIISIFVLIFGIIISILLSNKIINPIKKLTYIAERMANGELEVRSNSKGEDEIAQLSTTLDYMAEELVKREQLKDEFISSVSHELRTPLTAIKGWVITLKDNDQTDQETFELGFNILEKETDRLANMVEELLDFSRLVNGKITLKRENIYIGDIVEYIKNYMQPRAIREGINFNVLSNIDNEVCYLDSDRLKQVLINLIDNSFKFVNENAKVEVTFEIRKRLIIVVKDNGCGISADDLPRVKEKFFKGKNAKSQNGIGLSICDEIVTLHDGTLEIFSKEGEGTKAIIEIPIEKESRI